MTAPTRHSGKGPRRVIVHIGMPKTGTSSIQAWLYGNRRELSRQGFYLDRMPLLQARPREHLELAICQFDMAGELMPNQRMRYVYGFSDLAGQAAVARRFTELFARKAAVASEETVLMSVEDVGGMTTTEGQVAGLESWLGQFFDDIRYIVYFRRQEDVLPSAYSQLIKTGRTLPFEDFFEKRKQNDYFARVAPWISVVGKDRITIRLLESDEMLDGDLIADFAAAAGIDPKPTVSMPRQNESLTAPAGEFLRILNRQLKRAGEVDPGSAPVRSGLNGFLVKAFADMPKYTLSNDQVREIRELNCDSNEQFRAAYFPHREELFPARPERKGRPAAISPEQVAEVGAAVLVAMYEGSLPPQKDIRTAPRLHQKVWRHLKERHPAIATRIAPIIGREVNR